MPRFDRIRTAFGRLRVVVRPAPAADLPAAPTGLTATAASAAGIDLAWVDNASGAAAFEVQESTDGGATWATVATTAEGATTYGRSGLAASTTYHYRVRAVGDAGASAWSAAASATTLAPAVDLPAAPTGLTATAVHDERIDLAWVNNATDATTNEVQRSDDGGATWTSLGTDAGTSLTGPGGTTGILRRRASVGLTPATTYHYRVRVSNAAGASAWSLVASATTYPEAGYQEHVIADFADGVLPDAAWMATQPVGTVGTIVANKSDSGNRTFSIGVGEGVGGSNALKVTCAGGGASGTGGKDSDGLPGFFLYPQVRGTGNVRNPHTLQEGYLLPYGGGRRANRLKIVFRFQDGFRAANGAHQPMYYQGHASDIQNFHVGTYCYDPARDDYEVKESSNWHFYHHPWLRHDLKRDGWFTLVVNDLPQYQRNVPGVPNVNPTGDRGGYFEIMTRFYLDPFEYFGDAEIPYPVTMWVDSITMIYDPTPPPVAASIDGHATGDTIAGTPGVPVSIPATLTNTTGAPLDVALAVGWWYYDIRPTILRGGVDVTGDVVTLAPGPNAFTLSLTPGSAYRSAIGLVACPAPRIDSGPTYTDRSLSDPDIEKRSQPGSGPVDADVSGAFVWLDTR